MVKTFIAHEVEEVGRQHSSAEADRELAITMTLMKNK